MLQQISEEYAYNAELVVLVCKKALRPWCKWRRYA